MLPRAAGVSCRHAFEQRGEGHRVAFAAFKLCLADHDLGGAVFQALLGTLLAVVYSRYFVQAFSTLPAQQAQELGDRATQEISSSFEGAEAVAKTLPGADATQLIAAAQRAFTEGKGAAIIFALVSVIIAIVLVWWKYPKHAEENELFSEVRRQDDELATADK